MKDLFKKYNSYKKAFHLEKLRKECVKYAFGDVLEFCSGLGVNFDFYNHNKVISITAIDKNSDYLDFSRNIVKKELFNKFIFNNDEVSNFLNNTKNKYNCIILPLCLCVFDNPDLIIKKSIRILKDGGLIISFQHGSSKFRTLAKLQKKLDFIYQKKYGCHLVGDYNQLFTKFNELKPILSYKKYIGVFHVSIYKKENKTISVNNFEQAKYRAEK